MKTINKITSIPNSSTDKNRKIVKFVVQNIMAVLFLCGTLLSTSAFAQSVAPFDVSPLVKIGDNVSYGSYIIYKIGEEIYMIDDPGTKQGSAGSFGVDMYLICGEKKALMIDLGNDYIHGKEGDNGVPKRENAAEELREVVYGLVGNRSLEIAVTHSHGDHTGMIGAFVDQNVLIWKSNIENVRLRPRKVELAEGSNRQSSIDYSSAYTLFTPGEKTFDLGGGRIVETLSLQGHTDDGVVYILKKDLKLFTGDAISAGYGLGFQSVVGLKKFAEGTRKLVDYIFANFKPYERYALEVHTGHSWQNMFNGYISDCTADVGYLDWRYIQNLASCAQGIFEGKWLVPNSGIIYAGNVPYTDFSARYEGMAIMVCGIGGIVMPLELAYEAAGLEMPE